MDPIKIDVGQMPDPSFFVLCVARGHRSNEHRLMGSMTPLGEGVWMFGRYRRMELKRRGVLVLRPDVPDRAYVERRGPLTDGVDEVLRLRCTRCRSAPRLRSRALLDAATELQATDAPCLRIEGQPVILARTKDVAARF